MNKKGFTVIELTVSFSLVTIIAILLFNLIFSLKELYVSGDIKTALLNKQAIMEKKIYDDLNSRNLIGIQACGISCLDFRYSDNHTERLLIDVGANTITYGNYTMKLNKGAEIGQVKFSSGCLDTPSNTVCQNPQTSTKDNDVFYLDIPVTTSLLDDDFGIHIVKTYNKDNATIVKNININDATIIANGIPMPLRTIADDWSVTLDGDNKVTFGEIGTTDKVIFAQIFYQSSDDDAYFNNYNEFLKINDPKKFSTLKSLEIFRNKDRIQDILNVYNESIEASQGTATQKEQIERNYSAGYFELIIDFPSGSNAPIQNYNRWIQLTNFTNNSKKVEPTQDAESIDALYPWGTRLVYVDTESNYVSGANNDTFKIGVKKNSSSNTAYPLIGPTAGTENNVSIWVRANEYVNKYGLATLTYN